MEPGHSHPWTVRWARGATHKCHRTGLPYPRFRLRQLTARHLPLSTPVAVHIRSTADAMAIFLLRSPPNRISTSTFHLLHTCSLLFLLSGRTAIVSILTPTILNLKHTRRVCADTRTHTTSLCMPNLHVNLVGLYPSPHLDLTRFPTRHRTCRRNHIILSPRWDRACQDYDTQDFVLPGNHRVHRVTRSCTVGLRAPSLRLLSAGLYPFLPSGPPGFRHSPPTLNQKRKVAGPAAGAN